MPADEAIVKACACGGVIVAIADTSTSIERAVREHQAKVRHLIWRQKGGLEQLLIPRDGYEQRVDIRWPS